MIFIASSLVSSVLPQEQINNDIRKSNDNLKFKCLAKGIQFNSLLSQAKEIS